MEVGSSREKWLSGRFFLMSPTSSAIWSIRRRVPVLSFNLLRCTVEADCPFGRCKARASRLADILVLFPDPDEQREIGAYFCQWVELIAQNGAQVLKLRTDSFSNHWKLFFQPLEKLKSVQCSGSTFAFKSCPFSRPAREIPAAAGIKRSPAPNLPE